MPLKLVALIVAAALTTGWLLASIVSPPVAEVQELPQRDDRPERASEPASTTAFTEQLQLKLRAVPAPPVPRRNPFLFGNTRRANEPRAGGSSAGEFTAVTDTPSEPVEAGPPLRLAGIGSTTTDSGVVHTAVISDGATVHLLKVGETVMGYTVVFITADAVTIADAAGAQWMLRFE